MLDLIAQLEQAEGPSRELDKAIARHLGWTPNTEGRWHRTAAISDRSIDLPRFTSSLDAALTLIPPGARWVLYSDGHAYVGPDNEPTAEWCGYTPALALCVAALRARAAQEAGQ